MYTQLKKRFKGNRLIGVKLIIGEDAKWNHDTYFDYKIPWEHLPYKSMSPKRRDTRKINNP